MGPDRQGFRTAPRGGGEIPRARRGLMRLARVPRRRRLPPRTGRGRLAGPRGCGRRAVHHEELVDQLVEQVHLAVPDLRLGIEQADRRADPLSRIPPRPRPELPGRPPPPRRPGLRRLHRHPPARRRRRPRPRLPHPRHRTARAARVWGRWRWARSTRSRGRASVLPGWGRQARPTIRAKRMGLVVGRARRGRRRRGSGRGRGVDGDAVEGAEGPRSAGRARASSPSPPGPSAAWRPPPGFAGGGGGGVGMPRRSRSALEVVGGAVAPGDAAVEEAELGGSEAGAGGALGEAGGLLEGCQPGRRARERGRQLTSLARRVWRIARVLEAPRGAGYALSGPPA